MEIGLTHLIQQSAASSILVVDDDRASADLAAALLRSQRFEVHIVSSGAEALARIAGGGIDLVLLDLMMAKLDGAEVCAHVRHELKNPFLPIIITTSLHDRESRLRAKEAGADDVLVKPLDGLELLVRVKSLLQARSALSSLLRDRARLRDELAEARSKLAAERRATEVAESVSEALFGLLDDQQRVIESAHERASSQGRLQEQLRHLLELTVELRHYAECLAGTGTITIVAANTELARELRELPKAVAKLRK